MSTWRMGSWTGSAGGFITVASRHEWSEDRNKDRVAKTHVVESGQGLLAVHRVHQGRDGRLLPSHRSCDRPAPQEPGRDPEALPRGRRRVLVLREELLQVPPRLDPN